MTDRELLLAMGWVEHFRNKSGCFKGVWWRNPATGEVLQQGYAAAGLRVTTHGKIAAYLHRKGVKT